MKEAFKPGRPLAGETARILRFWNDSARALAEGGEDRDTAVHEIRLYMKKTRALLRLIKSGVDEELFRREDENCRAAAALLAAYRTWNVLGAAVDLLERNSAVAPAPEVVEVLKERIRSQRETHAHEADPQSETAIRLRSLLAAAAVLRPESEAFDKLSAGTLAEGLRRSYRRGRRHLRKIRASMSDDELHRLRGLMKQLWYQLSLVRGYGSDKISTREHRLQVLTEKLGRDHDLVELKRLVLGGADLQLDYAVRGQAVLQIELLRHLLKKGLKRELQEFYRVKPDAFVKKLLPR